MSDMSLTECVFGGAGPSKYTGVIIGEGRKLAVFVIRQSSQLDSAMVVMLVGQSAASQRQNGV